MGHPGVNLRTPPILGVEHPNVLSYIDILRNRAEVGQRVAIIGAGGIGFDIDEYLLHDEALKAACTLHFFAFRSRRGEYWTIYSQICIIG